MIPGELGLWEYLLIAICFILWVYALVDVLRSRFEGKYEKLMWVLIVLFISTLGAVIYLLFGRSHKLRYS